MHGRLPSSFHRSTWVSHERPGWHFPMKLYWMLQLEFITVYDNFSYCMGQRRKRRSVRGLANASGRVRSFQSESPLLQTTMVTIQPISASVPFISPGRHVPRESPSPTQGFNGVGWRPDHKTWVTEMKLPKHKNKQYFSNFRSEAQAARASCGCGLPSLLDRSHTCSTF